MFETSAYMSVCLSICIFVCLGACLHRCMYMSRIQVHSHTHSLTYTHPTLKWIFHTTLLPPNLSKLGRKIWISRTNQHLGQGVLSERNPNAMGLWLNPTQNSVFRACFWKIFMYEVFFWESFVFLEGNLTCEALRSHHNLRRGSLQCDNAMGSCKVNTVENRVFTTVLSHWDYVTIKPPLGVGSTILCHFALFSFVWSFCVCVHVRIHM